MFFLFCSNSVYTHWTASSSFEALPEYTFGKDILVSFREYVKTESEMWLTTFLPYNTFYLNNCHGYRLLHSLP